MDKTNLSKKAGLLMAGCLITLNAFGQARADALNCAALQKF